MTTSLPPPAVLAIAAIGGVAGFGLLAAPAGGGLSVTERTVVRSVDAGIPDALELLQRTVDMNSGTMNFEGVREVGAVFRDEFQRLGFTTEWIDGADWGRSGHVVAERSGAPRGPHFLFIGHIDTVFEPDSPFQRWAAGPDSTAAGPGVIDMKGGIVVMLLALEALREAGALDDVSVTVVLTGDEEKAGSPLELARRDLRAAAERADYALGFEDGDGDPKTAVVARRSAGSWRLQTTGKPAHSSQIFREDIGSGAIFEAARILAAFHESLRGERYLTFNPGAIVGGTTASFDGRQARGIAYGKVNVIPESAIVSGDLRSISEEQRRRAQTTMRTIVAAHLPHTTAEIEFDDRYPPLSPTPGNKALLKLLDGASRDLGLGPVEAVDPARAGAADISFTAGLVKGALDGLGLMGDGGHTVDEYADLRTLPGQAKRVAVLMLRVAAERP